MYTQNDARNAARTRATRTIQKTLIRYMGELWHRPMYPNAARTRATRYTTNTLIRYMGELWHRPIHEMPRGRAQQISKHMIPKSSCVQLLFMLLPQLPHSQISSKRPCSISLLGSSRDSVRCTLQFAMCVFSRGPLTAILVIVEVLVGIIMQLLLLYY